MTTLDMIRNAETEDAVAFKTNLDTVLSKKAWEKVESMKSEIASGLLKAQEQKEGDKEE